MSRTSPPAPTDWKLPRWARIADALTVFLASLTIWASLFGGIRFYIGDVRISATSVWRLFFETAAVFALRHVLLPRAPLYDRVRNNLARVVDVGPTLKTVISVSIATRIPVLLIGYIAVNMIGYPGGNPPWRISENEFQNLPGRWDTGWYLGIAIDGYTWTTRVEDQQNLNFFPAFPMLMRAASLLLMRTYSVVPVRTAWAGVLVSLTAFFFALLYLYRSARERFGSETAGATVLFLSTYPFAVFFSAAYSESVFLLGAAATFVHFRRGELVLAGLWGLLIGLVRPNGCLLSLPLAVMIFMQWQTESRKPGGAAAAGLTRKRIILAVAAAGTPVVGMLLYSLVAYRMTGHPFIWAELQRVAWGRTPQGLDEALFSHFQRMGNVGLLRYLAHWPGDAFNLIAAVFAIITIWPVTRRIGVPEGVFVAVNVLVPLFNGGLISMGRFTSVLFPSFLWLGMAVPVQHRALVAALFAMGQGVAAALFFTWRSIF